MMNKSLFCRAVCMGALFALFQSIPAQGQTLTASDVSVLWPLKASPSSDAVFKKAGDGFCNALSLNEGTIFPQRAFEKFSELALNASRGECRRDTALEDQFFLVPDEEIIRQDVHLALVKGLAPSACQYSSWKVTGMRFDPCRPAPSGQATENRRACNNVLRLVAQPFEKQTNGLWAVRDFTIHLAYIIPDLSAFLNDIKETSLLARKVEAAEAWEPEWDSNPQVLRPHHALRNELGNCNGAYSSALKRLVTKWAQQKNLILVAWMTSSLGVKEWTFGHVAVSGNGEKFETGTFSGRKFSNFNDTLFQEGKPSTTASVLSPSDINLTKQLALAGMATLPAAESSAATRTAHIDAVQKILHPKKISQSDSDCVACHLAPQILDRLRTLYKTPAAVGSGEYKAAVWHGFLKEPRSFSQLRNFGYGPQFHLAVNRRTINETQDIFEIVTQLTKK